MSIWNEKAAQSAWERNPWAGSLAKSIRTAEVDGAAWQREALLSDEVVERAAEAIYRSHDNYQHFPAKTWAEMVKSKDHANKFRVKQDRASARAALIAAMEGGE